MAPERAASESSEDEAPEIFSFGSSKKAAREEQNAIQQSQAAEKLKQKQRNRERDRVLKERAEQAKADAARQGKTRAKNGKARAAVEENDDDEDIHGGDTLDDLEARMERAMKEAAEEADGDGDGEENDLDELEGDGDMDADLSSVEDSEANAEEGEGDGDDSEGSEADTEHEEESAGSSEEEDGLEEENDMDNVRKSHLVASKSDYLPDHLFNAAFSNAAKKSTKRRLDEESDTDRPSKKKRKQAKRQAKDVVIGSRTIRTLAKISITPTGAPRVVLPRAKSNRFFKQSLNMSGSAASSKKKGWERRGANVGVMKRDGPAASFVRSR